jgi:hypothetical protein
VKRLLLTLALLFVWCSPTNAAPTTAEATDVLCGLLATSKTASPQAAANACLRAAVMHKTQADRLSGALRQSELIHEASALYFVAQGDIESLNFEVGTAALSRSRQIFEDVKANAASPALGHTATAGIQQIDEVVRNLEKMTNGH